MTRVYPIGSAVHSYQHGMTGTPEFLCWESMIARCTNPRTRNWHRYGGRGIRVHRRWLLSFEAFFADMGPRPSPEHSLDREDNDGHYEANNCRWATREEQNSNRGDNHWVTAGNVTRTVTQWSAHLGITPAAFRWRIERWGAERAAALVGRRQRRGEDHARSKLTADQALDIYRRRRAGERGSVLAAEYHVSQTLIGRMMRGLVWAHVTGARTA